MSMCCFVRKEFKINVILRKISFLLSLNIKYRYLKNPFHISWNDTGYSVLLDLSLWEVVIKPVLIK